MDNLLISWKQQGLFAKYKFLYDIESNRKLFVKESHWIIGGDGWAYDIGFGGLDHILSKNQKVNIMIFDTEMYSNTGGQTSKATTLATSLKFALSGKREAKKDLGLMAMSYGNIYVASISMGANYNQSLQAIKEAEEYPGTSLILALSPCIDWGFDNMKQAAEMMAKAVDCGYWNLYRYNPLNAKPLTLDSKKIRGDLMEYLKSQGRFERLVRMDKDVASRLHDTLKKDLELKQSQLVRKSMDDIELLEYLKKQYGEKLIGGKATLILYGSETGTAETLAKNFADELKNRGIKVKCSAMDDFELEELAEQEQVYCVVSTCGDGALPSNCKFFTKEITTNKSLDLSKVNFAVFGLGDKSYQHFNESAKIIDQAFLDRGAKRIVPLGLGDDKAEEKWETAWYEWFPSL